jgi:hypothetical protein
MKKYFLIISIILLAYRVSNAQPPVIMGSGTGSGISGHIPRFNGGNTVTNSILYQNGPNNVGLNTVGAQTPFHIVCNNNNNGGLRIDQNGNSASAVTLNSLSAGGHNWGLWSTGAGHTGWVGSFGITDNTAGLTRFVIDPLGQIGIGNLNPAAKLDVTGTFNADGEARFKDRIYAGPVKNFQKAIIDVYDKTGGGYGNGAAYLETNHTGSPSYNTAIAVNQMNDQAFTIFNTTMPMGGMFGFKEFFTVMGDGTTNIAGTITNSILAGVGTRNLLVDASGKIIAGLPTTALGNWAVGGNNFGGNSSQIFGTLLNDHIDVRTNNLSRLLIASDGHFIFGFNPGYTDGNVDFNQNNAPSKITIGAFGLNGTKAYKSSLVLENAYGGVEVSQDTIGTGHLKWGGSNLMYFKGESILIGEPDTTDHPTYGILDINTKLTITTKTANGYTGFPLKIINPTMPNPRKTIFEVLQDGTTHIGNTLPTGTHSNAKLSVDGKVVCQSLYVTAPTNWADHVFRTSYKVMDLKDLEAYYVKNKHLPGVPSENEIKENGYGVNEMDAMLIQKVEELTLYIVELKKEIETLKKRIK